MNDPSNSSDPLVLVEDVSKEYRRSEIIVPVLSNMNLHLDAGDYAALMGPSGSGKSTLLNLIAGLDTPTSGHVYVCGQDLGNTSQGELAKWRSRHVGFIFQMYNLVPVLTAYENVELPLTLAPLNRRQRKEQVRTALEIVGLADRMDHYPRQLSGGEEQRVSIARAIATDPTLIVADEPTGDLDAKSGDEILKLMSRLNEDFEKTIVMVTHDPHAASCAQKIMHMEDGRLVDQPAESAMGNTP
jgi:putative ABC transport system ATP-binding protein